VLLTADELPQVWSAYRKDASPHALNLLIRQYAPLAGYLARRALARAPAYQDTEDILSYAQHGLLDAISKFDPDQDVKFETYATRRIAGAIVDGQRKQDPLGRTLRKRVKTLEQAIRELWELHDREPTSSELAAHMGIADMEVRQTLLAQKSLAGSLDADNGVAETYAHGSEAESSAQMAEILTVVARKIAELEPSERAFFLAHYCQDLNLKGVGEALAMSHGWCRQTRFNVWSRMAR